MRSIVLFRWDKQIMRNEQPKQRRSQHVLQSCQSCKQKKTGGKDSQIVPDLLDIADGQRSSQDQLSFLDHSCPSIGSHHTCRFGLVTHSCNMLHCCRYVQAQEVFLKKEKELMKNVPGYKVGENLYSGGRWMPPAPRVGAWGGA